MDTLRITSLSAAALTLVDHNECVRERYSGCYMQNRGLRLSSNMRVVALVPRTQAKRFTISHEHILVPGLGSTGMHDNSTQAVADCTRGQCQPAWVSRGYGSTYPV